MTNEFKEIIALTGMIALAVVGVGIGFMFGVILERFSKNSSVFKNNLNNYLNTKLGNIIVNIMTIVLRFLNWFSEIFIVLGIFLLLNIFYFFSNYEFNRRIYSEHVYIDICIYMLLSILLGFSYYKVQIHKRSLIKYILAIVFGGFFISYYFSDGKIINNRFITIVNKFDIYEKEHYLFFIFSWFLVIFYVVMKLIEYIYKKNTYSDFFLNKKKIDLYLNENYDCSSSYINYKELYDLNKILNYRGFSVVNNELVFDKNNLNSSYNELYSKNKKQLIKYSEAYYFFHLPIRTELINEIKLKNLPNKYCFLNFIYKRNISEIEEYEYIFNRLIHNKFKIYFVFTYNEIINYSEDNTFCDDILLLIDEKQKIEFIDYINTTILKYSDTKGIKFEYYVNVFYDINLYFSREIFLKMNKKYLKNGFYGHLSHDFFIFEHKDNILFYYIYGYVLLRMDGYDTFVWNEIVESIKNEKSLSLEHYIGNSEISSLFEYVFFDRKHMLK